MSKAKPRLLIISAYHAQSHDYWAQQLLSQLTEFDSQLISLPPRYFAWRMGGNALSLATEFADVLAQPFDCVLATSMVDLATLKGLCPMLAQTRLVLYCHENQFEYPVANHSNNSHSDNKVKLRSQSNSNRLNAQMRSIFSALAADTVVFNSQFNRDTFFAGCADLLDKMPDFSPDVSATLQAKSNVIGIPLSTDLFQSINVQPAKVKIEPRQVLRIAWVARWEYDKGMDQLLAIADGCAENNIALEWLLLGQQFRQLPASAQQLLERHQATIVHAGFVEKRQDYLNLLSSAQVVLSTSQHEFYGIAMLEAVACGCWPILPKQQVYPYLYPEKHLYCSVGEALAKIKAIYCTGLNDKLQLRETVFNQAALLQQYRQILSDQ